MERDIVRAILKAYRQRGAYAIKIHGGPYQPLTIDILACYRGYFIGLEVKDGPAKNATKYQLYTLTQITEAGGCALVAHSVDEATDLLNHIDEEEDGKALPRRTITDNR